VLADVTDDVVAREIIREKRIKVENGI